MLEERLTKAIRFFRSFQEKSDKELYRKSVLKFCDLVEELLKAIQKNDAGDLERLVQEELIDAH